MLRGLGIYTTSQPKGTSWSSRITTLKIDLRKSIRGAFTETMPKTRARNTVSEWEQHREELRELYKNCTAGEIADYMKKKRRFCKTEPEYRHYFSQWGFKKSTAKERWEYAFCMTRKRKREGKEETATYSRGKRVSEETFKKEVARNVSLSYQYTCLEVPPTPDGIKVCTPVDTNDYCDPGPQSPGCIQADAAIDTGISLHLNDLPCFQFQNDQLSLFGAQNTRELDISSSDTSFQTPFDTFLNLIEPLGDPSAFDFNYTLPQSAVVDQEYYSTTQDIPHNSQDNAIVGSVPEELLQEARKMLSECLQERGHTLDFPAGEEIGDITRSLEPVMIEQRDGDLARSTKKLFGHSKSNALLQFFQFCVYISSNNLLTDYRTEKLLRWLTKNGFRYLLKDVLRSKSTTAQVFASNLLRIAVRQGDIETSKILIDAGTETDVPSGMTIRSTALQEALDVEGPKCIPLVRMLLDAGANPNTGGEGRTPLCSVFGYWQPHTLELVRMLLKAGAKPDPQLAATKKTPLQLAVRQSRPDVVQLLLDARVNPNRAAPGCLTPLQLACMHENAVIVDMLLGARADVNATHTPHWGSDDLHSCSNCEGSAETFRTPIQIAAEYGNWEAVQLLLKSGAKVNASLSTCCEEELKYEVSDSDYEYDGDDWVYFYPIPVFTPLQAAVKAGEMAMVRLLLSVGAHIDARLRNGYGFTALQIAVLTENKRLALFLLQKGADINAPAGPYNGLTTLQAAAMGSNNNELLTLLIESGADVNMPAGKRGCMTALQAAVRARNIEAVDILINAGAEVNARPSDVEGKTALQTAASMDNNTEMVKTLLKAGADINDVPGLFDRVMALQAAVKAGQKETVQLLLEAGATVDLPTHLSSHSPLLQAAKSGDIEIAKLLLSAEADPNIPASYNNPLTPLQEAARKGNIALVELFLSYRADANTPAFPSEGRTCLQAAAEGGSLPVVKALYRAGADPNLPPASISGVTALEAAVEKKSFEIVKFLLENGSTLSVTNHETNILSLAVRTWTIDEDLIKILIKAGADVNPTRIDMASGIPAGRVLLQEAAERASYSLVQTILSAGADVNLRSCSKYGPVTAIQAAVRSRNIDIIQALLDRGANINAPANKSYPGFTALQEAVSSGNLDIVRLLLDNGADVNAAPSPIHGRTALQAAASNGNIWLTKILLQRGAEVNAPAALDSGVTALQGAAIAGNIRIVMMLLAAGADINGAPAIKNGRTAIEGQAENGRLDTLHLLLNHHPDAEDLELKRTRASKLAFKHGHFAISRFIKAYKKN
ncbi:hypothetical protein MaudMau93_003298 [Microsporum audouinii]